MDGTFWKITPLIEHKIWDVLIGPILDDRLKEKLLKPWKGAHSSHFRVCLSQTSAKAGLEAGNLAMEYVNQYSRYPEWNIIILEWNGMEYWIL